MATEKRLIDANAIKYEKRIECFGHGDFREVQKVYKRRIDEMPTVDAVEVVRCKDCVWCHKFEDLNYCENPNTPWIDDPDFDDITVADNDFCSYGERKDNEPKKSCLTCENDGFDMPQCKNCNPGNGFMYHQGKKV